MFQGTDSTSPSKSVGLTFRDWVFKLKSYNNNYQKQMIYNQEDWLWYSCLKEFSIDCMPLPEIHVATCMERTYIYLYIIADMFYMSHN